MTFALDSGSFFSVTFPLSLLRLFLRKVAKVFFGPMLDPNVSRLPNLLMDENMPRKLLIGSRELTRFFGVRRDGMVLLLVVNVS